MLLRWPRTLLYGFRPFRSSYTLRLRSPFVGWGLAGQRGFLTSLATKLRGLVTFLIAITTVGIAVILIMYTISKSRTPPEGKRRAGSRQLLRRARQQPMAMAHLTPQQLAAEKGEKFTISSLVLGREPPYAYSITFEQRHYSDNQGQALA